MITAKFGGSAVTPRNLHFVKQCLTSDHKCVVVSAVGKESPDDTKATDLLKQYYLTRQSIFFDAFADKYRRLATINGVNVDVDRLLYEAKARALNFGLDYCLSLGEELSAKITAIYLNASYIEAEDVVRFGKRRLLFNATLSNIASAFKGVELAVMGGFYGGTVMSRKVFPRGGSDITGSLCAVALGCTLYENWTDSYGVCVANPAKVFDVSTVSGLSYDEMYSLAKAGAEVLHSDAVKPCQLSGIPIKIGNFYNPCGRSTLISNCPSGKSVLSVAERVNERGETVTAILHSLPQSEIASLLGDFLALNNRELTNFGKTYLSEQTKVWGFTSVKDVATLTTDGSILVALFEYLKSRLSF